MGFPKGKGAKGQGKGKGSFAKGKGKGKATGKGKGKGKAEAAPKWVKVKGTVLVTGASGYLAMSIVRQLTEKQYKVRGTVRSLESEHTKSLTECFPNIMLYEADLVKSGQEAFEKAMEGCDFVMHTASPFQNTVEDPQRDLVDPAVMGTTKVVSACIKMGIKRCVVTSSIAAVGPGMEWISDPSKADESKVFNEEDWNTTSTLQNGAYRLSKYLAEKKAWELAEGKENFSVVCINPSFIMGPMMTSRVDGTSIKLMKDMLEGKLELKGFPFGIVDVRDVAKAHISGMEVAEAGGKRFLVTSPEGVHKVKMAEILRSRFKAYPIPTEGEEFPYTPKFSTARAKEILKWSARPVEVSLRDMANACIRTGVVEQKVYLKPVTFGKVSDIQPEMKGLNLLVKVVSVGDVEVLQRGDASQEVSVGDASGIVTLRQIGEELAGVEVGKIIEVRNAAVRMIKGYIQVTVGKFGKVAMHKGDTEITPNESKDMSAVEYELQ